MKANTKVYTPMMNGRCWLEKGQLQHNVTYLFHEINHKIKGKQNYILIYHFFECSNVLKSKTYN